MTFFYLGLLLLFASTSANCDVFDNKIEDDTCHLSSDLLAEIKSYGPTVQKIISAVTNGRFKGATYKELETFVDKFGARLSGTENLENAIDYVLNRMQEYQLENVHGEEVEVPHWLRGEEWGQLIEPRNASVKVLSLGSSVGTDGVIEADVLVVKSFDELDQANFSSAAKGKIVVFNNDFVSYGVSVKYRTQGALRAAQKEAVAVLIRSVTPFSMYTLHTGHQGYRGNVTKIPAVSITVEDAKMLQRMQDRGDKIRLRLKVDAQSWPEKISRNSVGEIVGTTLPKKVVLVSGHLDSWDVGVGAMDDGGGAFISWYALALLKALNLKPRRTLRAVLWTGEEEGYVGAFAYDKAHKDELSNHTFVMESDEGTFTPQGLVYAAGTKGGCILQEILNLLAPINATKAVKGTGVGSDISIWTSGIIPGASLLNANAKYFWFHHSEADTMDVLDPDNLDKATALWASVAYVIADLSEEFPREFDANLASLDKSVVMKKLLEVNRRGVFESDDNY